MGCLQVIIANAAPPEYNPKITASNVSVLEERCD